MSEPQRIRLRSNKDHAVLVECSWSAVSRASSPEHRQTVDLLFQLLSSSPEVGKLYVHDGLYIEQVDEGSSTVKLPSASGNGSKVFEFLLRCLSAAATTGSRALRLAKLIVPLSKGYIVRSDMVPSRLRDSQFVEEALSLANPLQEYSGSKVDVTATKSLAQLLSVAAAGLILHARNSDDSDAGLEALSTLAETELEDRLSLPLTVPGPPQSRTLVLVDANSESPDKGLALYTAAKELGIKLVVLDNAGHWLEEPQHAHWREAYIPTKLTNPPTPEATANIVESVKAYGNPVDGILTFADSFWPYIAPAAAQLGLKTATEETYRVATNKYLTSLFAGHQAHRATSLEEAVRIAEENDLPYPLIVKPCDGWSSEGVSRVESADQLAAAIQAIDTSRHGTEFVLEKYCSGPEVDVNLVMLDGELLFFEICDDFPKSADINGPTAGPFSNFHELSSVYPSALPAREIEILRRTFVEMMLKLGLKSGILHLEGRVENSTVDYQTQDGLLELYPCETQGEPSAWLIEINPRPLGMTGSQIIESTYGIDYWALALVLGVDDKPRVRALAQPYKHGAQYTCVMVFIPVEFPVTSQGIFNSDDICADLKIRRPDLAKHISRCACLVERGQKIPHPSTGKNTFLAYFNVFSRHSRREALKLATQVREEVRYSFI